MRRRSLVVLAALAAAAVLGAALTLAADGAGRATAAKASAPTYYGDVKPILQARCTGCHMDGGIAPFPLQTYAQARRHRAGIARAVATRHMPPWHADSRVRAYKHDLSLTAAQIARLTRWARAGGPAGDPRRPGRALPAVAAPAARADLELAMPEAYTPSRRNGRDDYRCFVLPWSPAKTTFVSGFGVRPGTPKQVHHIIVYLAQARDAATLAAWEAADATPGYSCYGGPGLGGGQIGANFLALWAPGSGGSVLPAGTGIELAPGSRLVMQVHYNLDNARPAPDRSVAQFQLTDAVEKRGSYVPLVDFRWLIARETFTLPAGKKRIVHEATLDPRPFLPFLGANIDTTRGFTIHSVAHHMHLLGRRGEVALVRANGDRVRLLSIPRWRFHWQREYQLAQTEQFDPGDRLSIRCEHDNSRANQPVANGRQRRPRTVYWGENSTDEMCIAFLYVTER